MVDKLVFEINDVIVLQDELPHFSKLKLQIVRNGNNAHNLPIDQQAINNAIPSLVGKPILCHYQNGEFKGHDIKEIPVGVILNQEDIFFEDINGIQWLCAYAYIWKRYFPEVMQVFQKSDNNKSRLSMEIDVLAISERNDGNTWIESFSFAGITLIGVEPAIPGASATVIEFAKLVDDFEKDKLLLFNQITHFPKHGHNKEIALKNSLYQEFDFDYAFSIKKDYPTVWKKGGNLRGDETFALWGKARDGDKNQVVLDWIKEREQWAKRHNRDKTIGGVMAQVKWGVVSDYGLDKMKETIEQEKKNHDSKNRAYFEGGEERMPYESLKDVNPALKGIDPPITLGQANQIAKVAEKIGVDEGKNGWAIAISQFKKTHVVKDGHWVEKESNMSEEEFAKEDLGKGEALKVDKSKDGMSTSPWGEVDKIALRNKVLGASNYKSLVKDIYALVEDGWEDAPSAHLKYPIMQLKGDTFVYNRYGLASALQRAKGQNESSVVSKLNGIYEKMGLDGNSDEEKKFAKEEENQMTEEEKKAEEERIKKEEMAAEEEKRKKEEFAAEEAKKKEEEKAAEEAKRKEAEEKKFALAEFADIEKLCKMLEGEEFAADIKRESEKEDSVDFGVVVKAMYAKMCKMAKDLEDAKNDKDAYMSKMQEYEAKFAEIEKQKFSTEVEVTLQEISDVMPKDEIEECRADSLNFSMENIDAWKNKVKALAFTHAKDLKKPKINAYALPFTELPKPINNGSVWPVKN